MIRNVALASSYAIGTKEVLKKIFQTEKLKPKILFTSSLLKPFITDITIIKIATPKDIPRKEKIDIIFKNPSFLWGLKYLKANVFSIFEINLFRFI